MASAPILSPQKWNPDIELLSFSPHTNLQRPRAWDRVPITSNARQGRKVWKRYQLRPIEQSAGRPDSGIHVFGQDYTDNDRSYDGRSIKRLRNDDPPMLGAVEENEGPALRYVATLRDTGISTPRRKPTRRKSLRPSVLKSSPRKESNMSPSKWLSSKDHQVSSPRSCKCPREEPFLSQGPQSGGPAVACSPTFPPRHLHTFELIPQLKADRRATLSPKKQVRLLIPINQDSRSRRISFSPRKLDQLSSSNRSFEVKIPSLNFLEPQKVIRMNTDDDEEIAVVHESNIQDHLDLQVKAGYDEQENATTREYEILVDHTAQPSELPRELLLAKDILTLDVDATRVEPMNETDGEEDIFQYLLAEVDDEESLNFATECAASTNIVERPDADDDANHTEYKNKGSGEGESPESTALQIDIEQAQPSEQENILSPENNIQSTVTDDDDEVSEVINSDIRDPEGLDKVNENNHARPQSPYDVEEVSSSTPSIPIDGLVAEEHVAVLTVPESPSSGEAVPQITTRSLARLSDDTIMLKAFLDRAYAKKAKDVQLAPSKPPPDSSLSPRRSPRKVLAERDGNSPSPRKPRPLAHRPGTPTSKKQGLASDGAIWEDTNEISAAARAHQPSRRSARSKKTPGTSKTNASTAGTPSLIPVRRADGTDPVVLQKGIAQELAVLTRANTRRNKGQAKLPMFKLEELQVQVLKEMEQERSVTRSQTRDARKQVGWDETLVYFQQKREDATSVRPIDEPAKPRVRQMRVLGGVNGTPAPKKRNTADMAGTPPAIGTPAPKRRGRSRA